MIFLHWFVNDFIVLQVSNGQLYIAAELRSLSRLEK